MEGFIMIIVNELMYNNMYKYVPTTNIYIPY